MALKDSIDRIYYEIVKSELRVMNEDFSGKITYNTLLYLKLIGSSSCTVTSIANDIRVSKSSVAIKVKEMEKQGLVFKERSTEDKRIQYLRLTPAAESFYYHYDRFMLKAIKLAYDRFNEDELAGFEKVTNFFTECYRRYRDHGEISHFNSDFFSPNERREAVSKRMIVRDTDDEIREVRRFEESAQNFSKDTPQFGDYENRDPKERSSSKTRGGSSYGSSRSTRINKDIIGSSGLNNSRLSPADDDDDYRVSQEEIASVRAEARAEGRSEVPLNRQSELKSLRRDSKDPYARDSRRLDEDDYYYSSRARKTSYPEFDKRLLDHEDETLGYNELRGSREILGRNEIKGRDDLRNNSDKLDHDDHDEFGLDGGDSRDYPDYRSIYRGNYEDDLDDVLEEDEFNTLYENDLVGNDDDKEQDR